jgi:hypothetical protein
LNKSTLLRKNLAKCPKKSFSYRVSVKDTNRNVEMSTNRSRDLIDG